MYFIAIRGVDQSNMAMSCGSVVPFFAAIVAPRTRSPGMAGGDEALIPVATSGGPRMFARIGVMRALNRNVERAFNPERKDHHWGRRKLARDQ
jgi:hypothetical protein